jgi:hypothetical protein
VEWSAPLGSFDSQTGFSVVYIAPQSEGTVNISAVLKNNRSQTTTNIVCKISGPPTSIPSTTTVPPTPVDTLPPVPTDTPAPTPEPTKTPSGPPARITSLEEGASVPQFISIQGEVNPQATGNLWLFVQDPNQLYYPSSMNPCWGEGTPALNGKWEIHIGVGVEQSTGEFNLVLGLADQQANQFIISSLENGCKTGIFPGFAELPPGVREIQRLKVQRLPAGRPEDAYGPALPIPDAGFPGQVSVTGLSVGSQVAQEESVSGTVTGADESSTVWVLVRTFYGRWFPQSLDSCKNIHTVEADGNWQTKVVFGGNDYDRGKPFDVAVVLADPQADDFFSAKQMEWCQANSYPGLLSIELPPGLSVKYLSRVIRK